LTFGTIDLNGHQLRLEATYATIVVEGQISGAGDLIVPRWYGYGTVILSEANTYTGTTQVDGGNLIIRNSLALGTADGTASTGTTLRNGGDLTLEGSLTVADELLTISNSVLSSENSYICSLAATGTDAWTGNIDVQGDIVLDIVQSLLLSGNLTSTSPHVLRANGLAAPLGLLQLTGTSTLGESHFDAYGVTVQVDGSLTGLESIYVSAPALQGAGRIGARSISVGYGGALWISGTENNPELNILSSSLDPAGLSGTATLNTGSV
jgi:autotransporter-associated beta strand protein